MEFKKENVELVPQKPGVYLLYDKKGVLLYVGKAKDLRERLKTHMSFISDNPRLILMLRRVKRFDYIVTGSEPEAILLENTLIKTKKPKYNIRLRDDKKYPYIKITVNEKYPRIFLTRDLREDGSVLIGPFHSAKALRKTLRTVLRIFPIRTCKYKLPSKRKINPCIEYELKRCPAPCVPGWVDEKEYKKTVEKAIDFFMGKTESVEEYLLKKIEKAKEKLDFEKAIRLRDALYSIREATRKQNVVLSKELSMDLIALYVYFPYASISIFRVRKGILVDKENFILSVPLNEGYDKIMASFIKQIYLSGILTIDTILLEKEFEELKDIKDALKMKRGVEIIFRLPVMEDEKKLMELVQENAKSKLEEYYISKKGKLLPSRGVIELKENLGLKEYPLYIECVDISHTFGEEKVGSIVVFKNGRPDKKSYRKYKITKKEAKSDTDMMEEVIRRRFKRLKEEGRELPSLFIVDGGKPQLSVGLRVLKELRIEGVNICAFAKTFDQLYFPGNKVVMIPKGSSALKLLRHIRNEAHRFAISYHRKKLIKKTKESVLDRIPGLGEERKKELLRYFGSVKRIIGASVTEISRVRGIGEKLAKTIYFYLHNERM
jgi:excinuclease ABC subunit C